MMPNRLALLWALALLLLGGAGVDGAQRPVPGGHRLQHRRFGQRGIRGDKDVDRAVICGMPWQAGAHRFRIGQTQRAKTGGGDAIDVVFVVFNFHGRHQTAAIGVIAALRVR